VVRDKRRKLMNAFKVLVPLDGSRLAEHSLAYLAALKCLGETKVLLVGVVNELREVQAVNPDAEEREENLLLTYLTEVASEVGEHLGIAVETKVLKGVPAARLVEEAETSAADLLVITTHGRSGISRWRFGSVADKVIRSARTNTLVIGPKAVEQAKWFDTRIMPTFQSILVPLDGSPLAEAALPVAENLAESFGATLHLVRAVEMPFLTGDIAGGEINYMPEMLDSLIANAQEYLAGVVTRVKEKTVSTVCRGPTAIQLSEYVEENQIDLIVMTSHGRGGIARAALGSVTDRMLGGPAPVLIVRPGGL
jgi:nucleotide-binding universal stress UspA family protein